MSHSPDPVHISEHPEQERAPKRIKLESEGVSEEVSQNEIKQLANTSQSLLPPSRKLLAIPERQSDYNHTEELDVGISEYLSHDLPPIHAIIKQRYVSYFVKFERHF